MKKRIISTFILVLLSVIMLIAVDAADECTFSLVRSDTSKVYPGDTVVLDLTIENNPGLLWAKLNVEYDTTKLELISVEAEGNFKDDDNFIVTLPGDENTSVEKPVLYWNYREKDNADLSYSGDGVIAHLTFKVGEYTTTGKKYSVGLSVSQPIDIRDINDTDVNPVTGSAKIAVYSLWNGVSLNLRGKIGVNFYVKNFIADDVLSGRYYAEFTYDDKTITLTEAVYDEDEDLYYFACDVAATEMTRDIQAKLIKDGHIISTTSTSVQKYANSLLSYESLSAYHPVINAMLDYGYYAQEAFNDTAVRTREEAPSSVEGVTASDLEPYYVKQTQGKDKKTFIKYYAGYLSTETETILQYVFLPYTDTVDMTNVKYYCNGAELECNVNELEGGGCQYIVPVSVNAINLGDRITVTARYFNETDETDPLNGKEYTVTDGCLYYCYLYITNSQYEATLPGVSNLSKAMYLYYKAAYESPINTLNH